MRSNRQARDYVLSRFWMCFFLFTVLVLSVPFAECVVEEDLGVRI